MLGAVNKTKFGNCITDFVPNTLAIESSQIVNEYELDSEWMDEYVDHVDHVCSEYTSNILTYIAGYVQKKIMKVEKCSDCYHYLMNEKEETSSNFLDLKNEGGLQKPVQAINTIVKETESVLHHFMESRNIFVQKNIIPKISCAVIRIIIQKKPNFLSNLDNCNDLCFENNHRFKMMKNVVKVFLAMRLRHLARWPIVDQRFGTIVA